MITCFVSPQPDGSVLLTGRLRNAECSSGHFRQRLRAGETFYGIGFDEWLTLSGVDVADDGAITKRPRDEPAQNAERPPFLRGAS